MYTSTICKYAYIIKNGTEVMMIMRGKNDPSQGTGPREEVREQVRYRDAIVSTPWSKSFLAS